MGIEKQPREREKPVLLEPHFQDEDKGREYLAAMIWPEGPICPLRFVGEAYKIIRKEKTNEQEREDASSSEAYP